ncbi:MAG TPA: hypothetical protein PKC30_15960 [Saprospiraceae bacterium]|nr:hypothetical protein [Saprospiraceae bacterium]
MKLSYVIHDKWKVAILLGTTMLLIIISNLIITKNAGNIQESFSSVVKDRLIVESYIYELAEHLYEKKLMIDNCNFQAGSDRTLCDFQIHNVRISELLEDFSNTAFTDDESIHFTDLNMIIQEIVLIEKAMLLHNDQAEVLNFKVNLLYGAALKQLHLLSDIQISEGKLLNEKTRKILAYHKMYGQFELLILLFIAFVIQSLIFASKSLRSRMGSVPCLN